MADFKRVGRINGSPLNGLCERKCIEVSEVFDGCVTREESATYTVKFSDFTAGTVQPFTFVSIVDYDQPTVSNLVITPETGTRNRVSYDLNIPLLLNYTDADGRAGMARGTLTKQRCNVLRFPTESLSPYRVAVSGALRSSIGSFVNADTVTFTACSVDIVKVLVDVDILVPTYGYPIYPDCVDCGNVCPGLSGLPLFPDEE